LAILFCLFLISQLPMFTKMAFLVWITIGLVVYFTYSINHSGLAKKSA